MRLDHIARELSLKELTPLDADGDADVSLGYASDLLSDVLAPLQVHLTVVAVASHAELAAVIFAGDRRPEDDVLEKASAEGLSLFSSPEPPSAAVRRLSPLG